MMTLLKVVWKLAWRNRRVWNAASQAVDDTIGHPLVQQASQVEPTVAFCPHCGQRPDGDRRMDHAREVAMSLLGGPGAPVKRFELDTALALHYFLRKS